MKKSPRSDDSDDGVASAYHALLVVNSTFPEDRHNLPDLEGPRNDGVLLRDALCHPEVGLFPTDNVRLVAERAMGEVLREADDFIRGANSEDTLLIYYSGHGMLSQSGELFLCTRDTRSDRLRSTAVKASDISQMIGESSARAMIVVVDCCYSGRFKGAVTTDAFSGQGRFVIASSRGSELAHDTDLRNHASLFTHHLVEGLLREAAARDEAGTVYLSQVYDYVHSALVSEGRQMPTRDFAGQGDVAIARRSHTTITSPAARAAIPDLAPNWFPDPFERHDHRWWNGHQWTIHVASSSREVDLPPGDSPIASDELSLNDQAGEAVKTAYMTVARNGRGVFTEPVLVVNRIPILFEHSKEYGIYNQHQQRLGAVRQIRRGSRTTDELQLVDPRGNVLLYLTRLAKAVRPLTIIRNATGGEIGRIVQRNLTGKLRFKLECQGHEHGSVHLKNWRPHDFSVQDHTGTDIARITKSWEGLAKAMSATTDDYVLQIRWPLEDPLRWLAISALIEVGIPLK